MGKAKKVKPSKGETKLPKVGLADQIEEDKTVKSKNRNKIRIRNDADEEVKFAFYNSELLLKLFSIIAYLLCFLSLCSSWSLLLQKRFYHKPDSNR